MDDLLREFLTETGEHLDTVDRELVRFEQNAGDADILRNIFRLVHTIKGTCGFLGLPRLETLAHAAETLMGRLRDGLPPTSEAVTAILLAIDRIKDILAALDRSAEEPAGADDDLIILLDAAGYGPTAAAGSAPAPSAGSIASETHADPSATAVASTIRVSLDTIENLMTVVSELVLTRNQLLDVARRSDAPDGYKAPLQRLSQVTAELQDSVLKTRMQPIGSAWAKLPRVLRDVGRDLGKQIDLVMTGTETELDRQLLELIRDPLTHMVRNAADHGIEGPAERVAAGKPAMGTISLAATNEGGTITITISDDGRGLDLGAIGRRAVKGGLVTPADLARLSDDRVAAFIFHPGFSTNTVVTALSGRGVGMDVVKTNIDAMGGLVTIATERGRGTVFTIAIPLTLAIMAALIVEVGGHRLALPQNTVVEVIRLSDAPEARLETVGDTALVRVRDEILPVVTPRLLVGVESGERGQYVAVMQVASRRFGLLLDGVLETEEIVVKPLGAQLRHIPVFSGHTILGDGAVVLILDPSGIARQIGHDVQASIAAAGMSEQATQTSAETVSLLVFRGGEALQAVPLSLVTRLEEVDTALLERAGEGICLQYRGGLMPVVTLGWPVRAAGKQSLIVFGDEARAVALAIDEIVDIVEEALVIQPVQNREHLSGTAVVRGRATEIVDVGAFLPWLAGADATADRSASPCVLLVDDQPFFRELLRPVLQAAGYAVRTAASAAEGARILATRTVDMLVADLDLGRENGLDLVAELRRLTSRDDVPAIVLASSVDPEQLDRARDLGVHDIVSKFDRRGLLAALAEIDAEPRLAA